MPVALFSMDVFPAENGNVEYCLYWNSAAVGFVMSLVNSEGTSIFRSMAGNSALRFIPCYSCLYGEGADILVISSF